MKKLLSFVIACALIICILPTASIGAADKTIKITLDPGHGEGVSDDKSTAAGSPAAEQWGGVNELYYNLTISEYTKERLEQYDGVKIRMTRTTNDVCPSLSYRARVAQSFDSDAFISIHNNMWTDENVCGSVVLIPNKNYRSEIGEHSEMCAKLITERLINDAKTTKFADPMTYSTPQVTYPDGSDSDQYTLLKLGKLADIDVVMIVECTFLSNRSDYQKHLSTDDGLKALGYAIADGLADYYSLSLKKQETVTETAEDVPTEAETDMQTSENTENNGKSTASSRTVLIIAGMVSAVFVCVAAVQLNKKKKSDNDKTEK